MRRLPFLFLLLFFFFPLASALAPGILSPSGLTLIYLSQLLSSPYIQSLILFTISQALASTILALLIGFPAAYLLAKFQFPGKSLVKAIATVPFVVPGIIVALGFILFFGNNGVLNRFLFSIGLPGIFLLYSWKGILLAHAFYNFPIPARLISSAWERLDLSFEDAGRTLGLSGFALFRKVTLPRLAPAIAASAALTFIFCFMSFGIVLILGGVKYATIEVGIYTLNSILLQPALAGALALVQGFFSALFLFIILWSAKGLSFGESGVNPATRPLSALAKLCILFYVSFMSILVLGPILSVAWFSFTGPTLPSIGILPLLAVRNSLLIASSVLIITIPLSLALSGQARSPFFGAIAMLPLGISAVTLALGYVRVFSGTFLLSSVLVIVLLHSILAYPFMFRGISAAREKISSSLLESARCLGASPWIVFRRIELPLLKGAILVGSIFVFAISLGEFSAAYIAYSSYVYTMPVAIFRFLSAHDFRSAAGMGVVLMVISAFAFFLLGHLEKNERS